MKKGKQILAIIGIILLVVLYLSTLVCAITDNTGTMKMFKASIFATFVIPVLIWAYTFLYKLTHKSTFGTMLVKMGYATLCGRRYLHR